MMSGLYLHTPFCRSICAYCDFYKTTDLKFSDDFVDAIIKEMNIYRQQFASFSTLYFGGGSPSLLSMSQFESITSALFHTMTFDTRDLEFTVECNPDDITCEKLALYKSLGVNRISLGVQSLKEDDLIFLGRKHSVEQVYKSVDLIQAAGFDNFSIDLIYALPHQSLRSWEKILKQAIDFKPSHFSCYNLTVKEKTKLHRQMRHQKFLPLSSDRENDFFELTSKILGQDGYIHYEVSNFAASIAHQAKHNGAYWNRNPYLGLGPSAHSFQNNSRWWNVADIREYLKMTSSGKAPISEKETLNAAQRSLEICLLGFRNINGFHRQHLAAFHQGYEKIETLRQEGFIEFSAEQIIPTQKGMVMADELTNFLQSEG